MKKVLSIVMALALILGCCSFAAADEKVHLTAVIAQHSACPPFDDSPIWKKICDEAGVELEWETNKSGWSTRKSTMIGANEMPDLWIGGYNLNISDIQSNADMFVQLNDYIENSTYVKRMFEDYPSLYNEVQFPDGSIYALPGFTAGGLRELSDCWMINKTWLDYLGLEVPTTKEDFYTVMKAFKEKDPNQNGEADEIPIVDFPEAINYILNAFGIVMNTNNDYFCIDENGDLYFAASTEAFKEAMKYCAMLFQEGLADPEAFTQPWSDYYAYCGGETAIGGLGVAWTIEALMAKTTEQYVLQPALKDDKGEQHFNKAGQTSGTGNGRPIEFAISASCKDIDAAWRLIDTCYKPENALILNFGIINPEEGHGGLIDNGDGTYTVVPPPEGSNWDIWNISEIAFRVNSYLPAEEYAKVLPSEDMQNKAIIQDFYAPWLDKDVMPSCYIFDSDINDELSVIKTDISSLISSRIAAWCQGDLDIDADWEDYLAELDAYGLDRYVEIYTERFNAGK